jgi:hypothetical protein
VGQVHGDAGGGHHGGLVCVEAGARQPLPPVVARLEVHRHQPQPIRDAIAELDQPLPLPGLCPWLVDLEHPQPGGHLRSALGEGVQARPEEDVLADAAAGLFDHQILDEARAGQDGGAEGAGEGGLHVRPVAPPVVRGGQAQAHHVFEDVRRRIDLHVQGPPQGDPHRRVV